MLRPARVLGVMLAFGLAAEAHVVSMSSGELQVDGAKATYQLQIPLYETKDLKTAPADALFGQVHFRRGGVEAKRLSTTCNAAGETLTCDAVYLFDRDVDSSLTAECTLHRVLVANHVHMLHATMLSGPDAGQSDQAFFDLSFESAEVRFRPPTALETFFRNALSGFWRALSAMASLLLLISLVAASRDSRHLALLFAMFLLGELLAALFGPRQLPPRFLEASSALTVAYLAVEVLLLPTAGQRWLVVALLGGFHGLYFALFLDAGVTSRPGFLAGIAAGELAMLAAIELARRLFHRLFPGTTAPWTRIVAVILFAAGTIWFIARMIG